jgi:hypothetical protein
MNRIQAIVFFAIMSLKPIWASEPGLPMDCGNVVLARPDLTCTQPFPLNCTDQSTRGFCGSGDQAGVVVDNEGHLISQGLVAVGTCGLQPLYRHSIVRLVNGVVETLAIADDRCYSAALSVKEELFMNRFLFDNINGRLYVYAYPGCHTLSGVTACPYPELQQLTFAIDGFVPLRKALRGPASMPDPQGGPGTSAELPQ